MAASQDVATRRSTAVEEKADESSTAIERKTRESEVPLIPAVDIFEDAHQITVHAEMPGVSKEGLTVQADRNSLLIEGAITLDLPAGISALYADLKTTKYRRSFALSGELETEHIVASLKDGLLTVRIPKRAEFRTRKIKVEVP
jgi:HSP20 family molecular chaperone IbpA